MQFQSSAQLINSNLSGFVVTIITINNMLSLPLYVKPGSSKDEITMDEEGNLLVKIKERPIDGAANAYLLKFISKEFNIRKSAVSLEKGSTSRFKKILLDVDPSTLDSILHRYKK
jgi:uncharacterized protein (TIGR00251 family)